jgi:hypothetical protein
VAASANSRARYKNQPAPKKVGSGSVSAPKSAIRQAVYKNEKAPRRVAA